MFQRGTFQSAAWSNNFGLTTLSFIQDFQLESTCSAITEETLVKAPPLPLRCH